MIRKRKIAILLFAFLVTGIIRMPVEHALSGELRDLNLHREQLDISTREKIDQTAMAAAIGGMRTLVATFFSLHSYTLFGEQRWDELEQTYHTIVDFAPHTEYYWQAGAWHLSYNAASYYIHSSGMSPLRRREAWRSFIHRGRDFLERGIRNNPDDWALHENLALLLGDPNKLPAFRDRDACLLKAAKSYEKSAELGSFSPLLMKRLGFYCLARVSGREKEALKMARTLYQNPKNRKPTLNVLLYVLECHADPERNVDAVALEIFGDPQKAYDALVAHWQRTREGYPMDGVAKGIASMESRLGIPIYDSVLAQEPPLPPSLDDWFKNGP